MSIISDGHTVTQPLPTPRAAARSYLGRGFQPVPFPYGEKGPKVQGWHKRIITSDNVHQFFGDNGVRLNIGLRLGPDGGNLADVDLDCPAAVQVASRFLPSTDMISGRQSNPRSHYFYICESAPKRYAKLLDPIDNSTILELRWAAAGKGAQTMVPPSKHPSGERLRWYADGEPAQVEGQVLIQVVHRIGATVLLAREWGEGVRNDLALALSGALPAAGWSVAEVEHLIRAVCAAADDEQQVEKHVASIRATLAKLEQGEPVTGWSKLDELLDSKRWGKLQQWLGLSRSAQAKGTVTTTSNKDDDNQPNLVELSNNLEARYKFLSVRNNLYRYSNGVYMLDEADEQLRQELRTELDDEWKPSSSHFVIKAVKDANPVDPMGLNKHDGLMNVLNGMLDWSTGELREHSHTYRSTAQLPITWNDKVDTTYVDGFISEIISPDAVPVFWEYLGSVFIRGQYTPKKFALLVGPRDTGKSKVLEWITNLLG